MFVKWAVSWRVSRSPGDFTDVKHSYTSPKWFVSPATARNLPLENGLKQVSDFQQSSSTNVANVMMTLQTSALVSLGSLPIGCSLVGSDLHILPDRSAGMGLVGVPYR